jgi:DNA polymerase III subunit alpha
MPKVTSVKHVPVVFADVKAWYEAKLSPSVIDFDDPKPYEVYAQARWGGIFQLTSPGAQRLFVKAQPQNIIDIATLTSIYRPGPLAAHVDKLYLDACKGEEYDWGDRRINDILAKTKGLLIFQESVMELAEKCAGFPKAQCDKVRRDIMKRSISGGEAAKKGAQDTRDAFVKGCVQNNYTEKVANNLYDKILYFAGYGFNKCLHSDSEVDTYRKVENTMVSCTKMAKDMVPGDLVRSRDERTKRDIFVLVKQVHHNGVKKVVKVTLKTGETLRCTLDHKFRTKETGEMLSLSEILERQLSIVLNTRMDVNVATALSGT